MSAEKPEPIVSAVLNDPVVKAVLEHADALEGKIDAAPSTPAPPAPSSGQAGQVTQQISKPDVMILPSGQPVAAPTTTEEEDRTSAGQRATSDMWERTQRQIALSVTWAALAVAAFLAVQAGNVDARVAAFVFLYGVANLVIGFYFGRTNHQRVGGVVQGR